MFNKTTELLKLTLSQVYHLNEGIKFLRELKESTTNPELLFRIDILISVITYTTSCISGAYQNFFVELKTLVGTLERSQKGFSELISVLKISSDEG